MATLEQAAAQVAGARKSLIEKRKEASISKSELLKARARLPERESQQALRQRLAGLAGRVQRRGIKKVEGQITEQEGRVKEYEEQLTEFEEKQLKPAEAKVKYAQEYNAALKTLRRADSQGKLWAYAAYGEGLMKSLAQEIMKQRQLDKGSIKSIDTVSVSGSEIGSQKIGSIIMGQPDSKIETTVGQYASARRGDPSLSFRKGIEMASLTNLKIEDLDVKGLNQNLGTRTDIGSMEDLKTQEDIRRGNLRASALMGVPAQYLGTVFDKTISIGLAEKGAEGSTLKRIGTFLDPRYQYEISKEYEQSKLDIQEAKTWEKRFTKADKAFAAGDISAERYNALIKAYQESPEIKRLNRQGVTSFEALAKEGTETQKKVLGASIGVAQNLPYFTGIGRIILGTEMARTGSQAYNLAETREEKIAAGFQTGLGTFVALSGLKTPGAGLNIKGTPNQLNILKGASYASGITIGTSLGISGGVQRYVETGDKTLAISYGLGMGATFVGGTLAPEAIRKAGDYIRTRGLEKIETPAVSAKPFIRETRGGIKQEVYYERAGRVKWYNPKTYKYRGSQPGQFIKRQYRILDPKVQAKIEGRKEVTYWTIENGRVVQRTERTTQFPYDKPSEQLKWFEGKKGGVQQYYLPKKYSQPGQSEGFGYSASPNKFIETDVLDAYQKYYSGKGVSAYFFREGGGEMSVKVGSQVTASGKPRLYASYFEKVVPLKATKEVSVPSPLGGKDWKQYIFPKPTKQGVAYLPLYKPEVEAVVAGTRTSLGKGYYFNFLGRRIPIEEGIYLATTTTQGAIAGTGSAGSSYIPTQSSAPLNVFAAPVYSITSNIKDTTSKPIVSKSKSSDSSNLDFVSSSSNIVSGSAAPVYNITSRPSKPSEPYSPISLPSEPSYKPSKSPSYISKPSYSSKPVIKRKKTKPKPTGTIFDDSTKRWARKKIKEEPGLFEVFVKKKGKDVKIAEAKGKSKAKELLVGELKGTLAASGFVEKGGKKVKLADLGIFGTEFRRGKRSKETLVQRKTARFGTGGETRQAQYFRKKKGGNLLGL